MPKKNIIIGSIIAAAVIILTITFYYNQTSILKKDFEKKGLTGIAKTTMTVEIFENDTRDYTILDSKFSYWNKNEKEKVKEYMKKNHFLIKPGKYVIADNFKYERGIKEFKFEKSTEN